MLECDAERELTGVIELDNVKHALQGIYHKADPQHLASHRAALCFRFNHRFNLAAMLPRPDWAAMQVPATPSPFLKLGEVKW